MRKQTLKQISKFTLTVLSAVSLMNVAQASECAMSPNALADTQELAGKMMAHLGAHSPAEIVKIGQRPAVKETILNHKFHKIDRSKKGFKQFDAVGIITGKPYQNVPQSYGSAVLISPCHVLTNRHVVKGLAEANGESFGLGNRMYFSVGQAPSCDSKNDFAEQSLNARVVDFGANEYDHEDWAIVKLDQPVNSDIRPAKMSINPLMINQLALRVGFPYEEVKDKHGFKSARAQYVKGISAQSTGAIYISDRTSWEGASGSGIFSLDASDPEQLKSSLNGIYTGEHQTISLISIFETMSKNNRNTAADIKRALQTGSCQ